MAIWFDVFRTGKHIDSQGIEREWTPEDLDTIVAAFTAQQAEAPIVLGHPATDDPAYGWITALQRMGDKLRAKAERLKPELAEWVRQGRYKNVSISLYPNLLLKHVGLLGAVPPAVKGLTPPQFSEHDATEMTFSVEPFSGTFSGKMYEHPSGTAPTEELKEYLSVGGHNGRITPAQREAALRLGEMLLLGDVLCFSDEAEKLHPLFTLLEMMPKQVQLSSPESPAPNKPLIRSSYTGLTSVIRSTMHQPTH